MSLLQEDTELGRVAHAPGCCASEGFRHSGEMGRGDFFEMEVLKALRAQGPAHGEEQPHTPVQDAG